MIARYPFLMLLVAAPSLVARAQEDAVSCEQSYGIALGLYQDDRRFESLHILDSLVKECHEDPDQQQRILFLKAVIEARNDSVKAMRRTMEQLFRNDRHYVLKPYDPLIDQLPVKEEIFNTYERLMGSRDKGPGQLRKDHGQWRVGVYGAAQRALLEMGEPRPVFADDLAPDYEGGYGWEAGANMEWDVLPNLAVRAAAAWSVVDYDATSPTITYKERISMVPISIGVKKMFWLGDRAWVPYVLAEGSYAPLISAEADIARSGDGLRYLQPKSLDRGSQRASEQFSAGGAIGVGRKLGSTILYIEGRYRHALGTINLDDATYTESELLTNYYWLDRTTTLHSMSLNIGVQYVLRYHRQNRIYR
jgi:hypothetical protein